MIADLKPYAEYNKSGLPGLRQAPPYMPDAWIKDGATRIGSAISFAHNYYFSRVTFEAEPDPELRRKLQEIKTALQLPEEQVRLLTEAGGRILRRSPDYPRLLGVPGVGE